MDWGSVFCPSPTVCDHSRNTRINKCSLKVAVCHLDLGTKEIKVEIPFNIMFLLRDNQTF